MLKIGNFIFFNDLSSSVSGCFFHINFTARRVENAAAPYIRGGKKRSENNGTFQTS